MHWYYEKLYSTQNRVQNCEVERKEHYFILKKENQEGRINQVWIYKYPCVILSRNIILNGSSVLFFCSWRKTWTNCFLSTSKPFVCTTVIFLYISPRNFSPKTIFNKTVQMAEYNIAYINIQIEKQNGRLQE